MQAAPRKGGSDFHEMLGVDRQAPTVSSSVDQNGSADGDAKLASSSVHPRVFQDKKRLERHKLSRELKSLHAQSSAEQETTVLLPNHVKRDFGRKFNFGSGSVRPWIMAPIINPARKDDLVLYHWVRKEDANMEYIFSRLNTVTPVPKYTAEEYEKYLTCTDWTKESTDLLMQMAQQFDLRWIIVEDIWPKELGVKSLDDLRERYYEVHNLLEKARAEKGRQPNLIFFDYDNERRRREQLNNLWMRTEDEVKEEGKLLEELTAIEAHKLERQKKVLDLEKLISHDKRPRKAAEPVTPPPQRRRPIEPRLSVTLRREDLEKDETASTKLRMVEQSKSGVSLRSQRTRLVPLLGSNKVKAIEQALDCLRLDHMPSALNEEVSEEFNELRADILRLYEYKSVLRACEYEFETLKCQSELESESLIDPPNYTTSSDPKYVVAAAMSVPSNQETRGRKSTSSRMSSSGRK